MARCIKKVENRTPLERKYSSTLIVVNYHSDHPPISAKLNYWYRIVL